MDLPDFENPFGFPELRPGDVDELHAHVEELVAEHNLKWDEREMGWLEAEGALDERWFCSPTVRSEFDYLTALHEIGHHVLDLSTEDESSEILYGNEVDAWEWALAAARIETSEGARAQVRLTLQTHEDKEPPSRKAVARLELVAPRGGEPTMRWRHDERTV